MDKHTTTTIHPWPKGSSISDHGSSHLSQFRFVQSQGFFVPGASMRWVSSLHASVWASALWQISSGTERCVDDGSSYEYTEAINNQVRVITVNHCPNHPTFNLNLNYAISVSTTYRIPAYPQFVGTPTDSGTGSASIDLSEQGGGIGVAFSGAKLYSPFGGGDYGAVTGFDNAGRSRGGALLRPAQWALCFYHRGYLPLSRTSFVLAETARPRGCISLTPSWLGSGRFSRLRSSWPWWRDDADLHTRARTTAEATTPTMTASTTLSTGTT